MPRKTREAPWNVIMLTFKTRVPHFCDDVKQLRYPAQWEYAGTGTATNMMAGKPGVPRAFAHAFTFYYRGARPSYDEGELVLAKLNMLPEAR